MMSSHLKEVVKLTAEANSISAEMVENQLKNLDKWHVSTRSNDYCYERTYDFETFEDATRFVYEVGQKIKNIERLPYFAVNKLSVTVTLWSPDINGLHQSNFISAATCDEVYDRWDFIIGKRDEVTEASTGSFPASDPPAYTRENPETANSAEES